MLKAIIFDWHGVLDELKLSLFIKKLSDSSGLDEQTVGSLVKPIDRLSATGKIERHEYLKKVVEAIKINPSGFDDAYNFVLEINKNMGVWKLLPSLSLKYKLAIVSDSPVEKTHSIRAEVDLSLFDAVFFSSEIGSMKSSKEIFELALQKLNLKPQECLFIDDTQRNVDFAQTIGFQTCLFKSAEDIKKYLPGR